VSTHDCQPLISDQRTIWKTLSFGSEQQWPSSRWLPTMQTPMCPLLNLVSRKGTVSGHVDIFLRASLRPRHYRCKYVGIVLTMYILVLIMKCRQNYVWWVSRGRVGFLSISIDVCTCTKGTFHFGPSRSNVNQHLTFPVISDPLIFSFYPASVVRQFRFIIIQS
jgi:hypothetical protein